MDMKLMQDFEELEGISDQANDINSIEIDDQDEDDPNLKPTNASTLNSVDMQYEVNFNYSPELLIGLSS
jgi:hypothetical protein